MCPFFFCADAALHRSAQLDFSPHSPPRRALVPGTARTALRTALVPARISRIGWCYTGEWEPLARILPAPRGRVIRVSWLPPPPSRCCRLLLQACALTSSPLGLFLSELLKESDGPPPPASAHSGLRPLGTLPGAAALWLRDLQTSFQCTQPGYP